MEILRRHLQIPVQELRQWGWDVQLGRNLGVSDARGQGLRETLPCCHTQSYPIGIFMTLLLLMTLLPDNLILELM